jgi:hypothetical protein
MEGLFHTARFKQNACEIAAIPDQRGNWTGDFQVCFQPICWEINELLAIPTLNRDGLAARLGSVRRGYANGRLRYLNRRKISGAPAPIDWTSSPPLAKTMSTAAAMREHCEKIRYSPMMG